MAVPPKDRATAHPRRPTSWPLLQPSALKTAPRLVARTDSSAGGRPTRVGEGVRGSRAVCQ